MKSVAAPATKATAAQRDDHGILEHCGQELILYRLRCAQSANGLSHYYMYGDLDPNETLL